MRKKLNNKKVIILIIIIFICIIVIFIQNFKINKKLFFDDLFLFKNIDFGDLTKEYDDNTINNKKIINTKRTKVKENNSVFLKVEYKDFDFKNINLEDTIDNNTLINEKVAPGTKGEFEIIISSNEDLNYQIKFQSRNQKPANMKFYIKGQDERFNSLEELEENLKGVIKKYTQKTIYINWEWSYESNNDEQDTNDGNNLKIYNFDIYTIGY